MDCPICGLINLESAERCDCGYDFAKRPARAHMFAANVGDFHLWAARRIPSQLPTAAEMATGMPPGSMHAGTWEWKVERELFEVASGTAFSLLRAEVAAEEAAKNAGLKDRVVWECIG